jgi:hypothetical protein
MLPPISRPVASLSTEITLPLPFPQEYIASLNIFFPSLIFELTVFLSNFEGNSAYFSYSFPTPLDPVIKITRKLQQMSQVCC